MDDFESSGRYKALREEMRDLHEEVEKIRKKKANGADVEEIAKKVSDIESEMRSKFNSLQSGNAELLSEMRKLNSSLDLLRTEVATQKREVSSLQETNKGSVWARIPIWSWMLMGIGVFAALQLGLERWSEIKGALP